MFFFSHSYRCPRHWLRYQLVNPSLLVFLLLCADNLLVTSPTTVKITFTESAELVVLVERVLRTLTSLWTTPNLLVNSSRF